MQTIEWQSAFDVVQALQVKGYEAVIVGGAVRDLLLQRVVNDVDVATSALPQQVKQVFTKTVDVGIAHGTILVTDFACPIEVTTYRTDGEYSDHRRPDNVQFVRSLKEDLQRRDFTINALALTADKEIIDYYQGQQDLAQQLLRAVGEPSQRFREDALRMLRAARFASQLNFTVEQQTFMAINEQAKSINAIAIERIKIELDKLWQGVNVASGVALLENTGLGAKLIGNFSAQQWQCYEAKDALTGWLYFAQHNRTRLEEILQGYRFANAEKRFIRQGLEALDSLVAGGWQAWHYYRYDGAVLEAARHVAYCTGYNQKLTQQAIDMAQQALPIRSRSALAIDGRDLQQWQARKAGAWLKNDLAEIEKRVVQGALANDKETIREWYCYDKHNEG